MFGNEQITRMNLLTKLGCSTRQRFFFLNSKYNQVNLNFVIFTSTDELIMYNHLGMVHCYNVYLTHFTNRINTSCQQDWSEHAFNQFSLFKLFALCKNEH